MFPPLRRTGLLALRRSQRPYGPRDYCTAPGYSPLATDRLARAAVLAAPLRPLRPLYGSRVFAFGNGRACSLPLAAPLRSPALLGIAPNRRGRQCRGRSNAGIAPNRRGRQCRGRRNAVGRGNAVVSVGALRAEASKPAFAAKNAWGMFPPLRRTGLLALRRSQRPYGPCDHCTAPGYSSLATDGLARAAALAAPLRPLRPLHGSRVGVFGNGRACSRCGARSAPTVYG